MGENTIKIRIQGVEHDFRFDVPDEFLVKQLDCRQNWFRRDAVQLEINGQKVELEVPREMSEGQDACFSKMLKKFLLWAWECRLALVVVGSRGFKLEYGAPPEGC